MAIVSKKKIYEQVAEYIKTAIYNGEMKLGDAIYSENHLCEVLKVSRTSVRKAIREMIEANLLVSRPGVGTFVKVPGHGVIHNSVCLLNHYTRVLRYNAVDSYYMDIIYGTENEAGKNGTNFQIFSGPIVTEDELKEKTGHIKTDGLIVDGTYQDYFPGLEFLTSLSPHLVVLDGNPAETLFPTVAPDLVPSFRELLATAARRAGPLFFLYSDYIARRRWALECFLAARNESGLECGVELLNYGENVPRHLFNCIDHQYLIREVLARTLRDRRPACIICDSDHTAVNAVRSLQGMNFSVPDDVAVTGMSGIAFGELISPGVTTIRVAPEDMARLAVQRLLALIRGESGEQRSLSPTQVLYRGSL